MTPLGVLIMHGMGSQEPGYSEDCVRAIQRRMGAGAQRIVFQEIYWADLLESREDEVWRALTSPRPDGSTLPMDYQSLRRFVLHNFGDAIAYQRSHGNASPYQQVHHRISANVDELLTAVGADAPIVFVAHSLGAHVASNYLWDTQKAAEAGRPTPYTRIDNLLSLFTVGCQVALFSMAFPEAHPIRVPGRGAAAQALAQFARWENAYDRDDVLGWPVRPVYEATLGHLTADELATLDRIADREINVGGFGTAWNPACHTEYLTDRDFVNPFCDYLGEVLAALDGGTLSGDDEIVLPA